MKNTEIKWTDREIWEVLNEQLVAPHTSLEVARMNKRPETDILVCTPEEVSEMSLIVINDPEVCYE